VYFDDIVLIGSDNERIDKPTTFLHTNFQSKDLRDMKNLLDIKIMYSKKGVPLSHRKYVLDQLTEIGLMEVKPCDPPTEPRVKLTANGAHFSDLQKL
jgi:hypothetical protein